MNIRYMKHSDLIGAAQVHQQVFGRHKQSPYWIEATLDAFPRFLCFVAEDAQGILGYLIWAQRSGFRDDATVELDQIAVLPDRLTDQVGRHLVEESLQHVSVQLAAQGACVKHINVNVREDDFQHRPYQPALEAEVAEAIAGLYHVDEALIATRETERRAE